ncbi:MAG: short chain dehydrogenase [Pigmentiphaga sp.]|uniref:short chain dehydrogenase n=1 Tax=Pigmentiphaga sp. TaxID=1977564 RepID=UPI0029ADA2BA|nr:short chain dehydrogenase [Pigmentiphaga sp.]MDX3905111.1 short chain dehydrogenase [Pigmentiphaga sp.]
MTRQRVFLIGATGTIGKAVHEMLTARQHEVITGGLQDADIELDLSNPDSVCDAFETLGRADAVISAAGRAAFFPLDAADAAPLAESPYGLGLIDKLMGQVNLALLARHYLNKGGSVTLTSGTTSDDPIIGGSSLSMVNGGLEKWVMAAATEFPAGLRLNAVSPSIVIETPAAQRAAFAGFEQIPASKVALAYVRCLESRITGQTLKVC